MVAVAPLTFTLDGLPEGEVEMCVSGPVPGRRAGVVMCASMLVILRTRNLVAM
jgi:hypothetical protein